MDKHTAVHRRKHRRKKRAQRLALLIFCFVLIIGIVATIAISLWLPKYKYNPIEVSKPEELGFENKFSGKVVNIALFGLDARKPDEFKGLSDCIMILSLNSETKKIKLFSVMRDSLVAIEKSGKTSYTKINSAYLQGGPQLAIKTLNQNFNLDISEYVTVNFYGLAKIIDSIGTICSIRTIGAISTINSVSTIFAVSTVFSIGTILTISTIFAVYYLISSNLAVIIVLDDCYWRKRI